LQTIPRYFWRNLLTQIADFACTVHLRFAQMYGLPRPCAANSAKLVQEPRGS
jgi:hypothetical protein